MNQNVVIEGPDADGDGKPDWKMKLHITDKRLWVIIVLLGIAAGICLKLANAW